MDAILMFGSHQNRSKKAVFFYFLIVFFAFSTKAQRINGFNLNPGSNGVSVDFNIGPGQDCFGYSISHCVDSMSYVEIFNFQGICGTSGSNEFRSFTHSNAVLNMVNYYKIQLYPYEVAYNRIYYSNDGRGTVLVSPNPVYLTDSEISLKIAGVNNADLEGMICDIFGNKVQRIEARSAGDTLRIRLWSYKEGVYVLWLSDGARIYSTKFMVLYS